MLCYTIVCYGMGVHTMLCAMCLPYVHVAVICLAIYYLYHLLPTATTTVLCQQPYTTTNTSLSSAILPYYDINISTLLCCHHDLSLSLYTHTVSTRAGKSPWKAPSTAGFDMMSVRENVVFAFSEASGWTPYMEDR